MKLTTRDYLPPRVCTYCLGIGSVIGPSAIGYLLWRLTGRCLKSKCPECKGTGWDAQGSQS